MKNTTYIEKCLEFDVVTYILTFTKRVLSLILLKNRLLLKKGCFIGRQNQRFCLKKACFFFVQNPRKGVFFKLGYERGIRWSGVGEPGEHDDVIKWKHFPRYWPFVQGIHRSPVNSLHKGQWRGSLMLSLICVWINDWVNNREAGDLRRYRAHYDVTLMICLSLGLCKRLSDVWETVHYNDVIMGAIASQITSRTIVYSIVYSDADQRKHQSSTSLAFVRGIHRGPVNSSHKWPATRKMFPFDDVVMWNSQWLHETIITQNPV